MPAQSMTKSPFEPLHSELVAMRMVMGDAPEHEPL